MATILPFSSTQPFILSGSINWVVCRSHHLVSAHEVKPVWLIQLLCAVCGSNLASLKILYIVLPCMVAVVPTLRVLIARFDVNPNERRLLLLLLFVTSPTMGQTSNGLGCLSGLVTLYGGLAGGFTRTGQAMTPCCLQSNYSSTVTLHGGPVSFHPIRATQLFYFFVNFDNK